MGDLPFKGGPDIVIVDGGATDTWAGVTSENRLKVDAKFFQSPSSANYRLVEMTKNQTLTKDTEITVYSYTGSGSVCEVYFNLGNTDALLTIESDSNDIVAALP